MTIGVTAASSVPGTMMARVAVIISGPVPPRPAAVRITERSGGHRDAGDRQQRTQRPPRSHHVGGPASGP